MAGAFATPQREKSFSGLIDQAIRETGRAGALLAAIQYANLSVRECQAFGLFARDLLEDTFTATANPHIWTRPENLRTLRAVKYQTTQIHPKLKLPGRTQDRHTEFFYAADDYYAFAGVGVGEVVAYAAYMWQEPLLYCRRLDVLSSDPLTGSYDLREAYFDRKLRTWVYLNDDEDAYVDDLGDDTEEELRRQAASNWLFSDWYDMILEGTKAKLFKGFGDERAVISYANFGNQQKLFQTTVAYEAENFYNVGDS